MQLDGLGKQVEVLYDYYGIPHIYAASEEDAYFALGYVHAQDRLFQMEMIRRLSSGRLSEILGNEFIETDKFFKTIGLEDHANASAALYLNSNDRPFQKAALAYLEGINQFIEKGRTPVEFVLLGIPKEKFKPSDIFLATEYMAFNFALGFRTDPLMTFIHKKLGPAYLQELMNKPAAVNIPYRKPDSLNTDITAFNTVDRILDKMPVPPLIGSNAWVLAPSKSRSGKVLFANDTHIGYAQPGVWYEAHMEYPGYSLYGNHLAGFPFAAIGHTRRNSWGLTMFENDDLDFFTERTKPDDSTFYWSGGNWRKYEVREKSIKVKNGEDVNFKVRISGHGPLVQDVMPEWNAVTSQDVSLWWTHLKFPSNLLQVTYDLNHSQSLQDSRYAVSQLISPGLNVLYGDAAGNIAWWAAGRLVKRQPFVNPLILQDGSDYRNEPSGYYDFRDNPRSENPASGFVYSANAQPDTMTGGIFYPGYYVPSDRSERIIELLTDRDAYSIEDMQRMNNDVQSVSAPEIAHSIMDVVNDDLLLLSPSHYNAANRLLTWNGDHQMRDIGPVIYYKLIYHVLRLAMEDELGPENFKVFLGTHIMKTSLMQFVKNDNSVWWNNVKTKDVKESRNIIFDKAFSKMVEELSEQLGSDVDTWEWGRVHIIEHKHPVGTKKPLNLLFNVGPYPVPGGQEVLNQIAFDLNGEGIYRAKYGPAMRIVIDFADIENSKSVLPTGQSGNIMSRYYYDQAVMYNTGKSRKQKMNRRDIEGNKMGRLILQPAVRSGNNSGM